MGFWSRVLGEHLGITANANVPAPPPGTVSEPDWTPGDPDGVRLEGEETFSRSLPFPSSSPWSGWPADWATPSWNGRFNRLVDTAWASIDLNASVLSSFPVYRLRSGRIMQPTAWMINPDPTIYTSWNEFAKQLFWDYQLGECFVLPMARRSDGTLQSFRVVPPWLVNVEMGGGTRQYRIGSLDVTGDILHIRYQSTTDDAHGHGPLEASGARMVAAEVLSRYATNLASTGGTTKEWLVVEKQLTRAQADTLLEQWISQRAEQLGLPGVLSGGAQLEQSRPMSAKDLALLELAQFTEARIAYMLGVPAFLLGLPTGDSMTYSNVTSLFDYHDRASLRPKAAAVMSALSGWALPRGQAVELNRDEYSRPPLAERAEAYSKLAAIPGVISAREIRTMERLIGEGPGQDDAADLAASALTGGGD